MKKQLHCWGEFPQNLKPSYRLLSNQNCYNTWGLRVILPLGNDSDWSPSKFQKHTEMENSHAVMAEVVVIHVIGQEQPSVTCREGNRIPWDENDLETHLIIFETSILLRGLA